MSSAAAAPPCCGQSWSDPKVPHLCQLAKESVTHGVSQLPTGKKLDKPSSATPFATSANTAITVSSTVNDSSSGAVRRGGQSENIQVLIRIRPLIDRETGHDPTAQHFIHTTSDQTIEVQTADSNIKCKYDAVFGPSVSQEDVYDRVKECTEAFLDGFNATLFAYGQTGSGKSFTMFGAETDLSRFRPGLCKSQAGIIPRAIKDIFAGVIKKNASGTQQAAVFCSFVQIYNENLYDLLRDVNMDKPLAIHEDRSNGIFVEGLSEYAVQNVHDCFALLQAGEEHRAVRATHMNQVSSRSHSAFQLFLEIKTTDGTTIKSKFNLVDLAGSEKWHPDANMQYYHISEMTNINLSLHTLGRCIASLTTKNNGHVPYRDSKLTRLLQDSLGGNTKTRIIATLSPAVDCIDESVSTLKFADRAKQVMVCVRVNEQREIDPAYVEKLEEEIESLRAIVAAFEASAPGSTSSSTISSTSNHAGGGTPESTLVRLLKENADLKDTNTKLRRQLDEGGGRPMKQPAPLGPDRNGSSTSSGTNNHDDQYYRQQTQTLEGVLLRLKEASDSFFKFEIEEDQLKAIMDTSFKFIQPASSKGNTSATTMQRPSGISLTRPRTKCTCSSLESNGVTSESWTSVAVMLSSKPMAEVAFRVRGKSSAVDDGEASWQSDAPPKRTEEDDVKAAEKAMKKQVKLQAWLMEKERRELAKLHQHQEYIDEQRKAQADKDAKFFKRAQETKKRLSGGPPAASPESS
ncbi:hypothetical protein H257_10035 [Aphanomyces astaci]|uniref:Kinesin-like protein n=1 Tax=Aphanomyces astaci TaxID=112090 RepID=W4G7G2_APHAT|nr:hypothetical protein H257_10035 [Aphanomyces astaci]ETV75637.1 hypothetical protein H257_10035 [Aphanomyces astaci]|eukprot:XP_009834768.1 hypothetical protein H257_10035 [Aphanomyces astaci]